MLRLDRGVVPWGCTWYLRAYDANGGSQTLPGTQVIHVTSPADAIYTSTEYSYDVLGRESNELAIIGGVSKSMSYGYNLDRSLAQLTYPSGATVTYTPDSAGRMLNAVDKGSGQKHSIWCCPRRIRNVESVGPLWRVGSQETNFHGDVGCIFKEAEPGL